MPSRGKKRVHFAVAAVGACGLCVAVACSPAEPPPEQGLYERLPLALVEGGDSERQEVVARFEVDAGGAPWEISGVAPVLTQQAEFDLPVTRLKGSPEKRVSLADLDSYGAFNQIALELVVTGRESVRARGTVPGGGPLEVPELVVRGRGRLRTLELNFPACAGLEQLELAFAGTGTVELHAVELRLRAARRWFGAPTGIAALVPIDGDWRRALPLALGTSLESAWSREVVRPGDRLQFACGLPAVPCSEQVARAVRARISGSEGAQQAIVASLSGGAWRTCDVDLGAFVGQRVCVSFELDAEGPDVAAAVGAAALVRRGDRALTVVLVTSDTHRADHLGLLDPDSRLVTPFLDGLARDGALFTDCLAPSNCTNPSHATLLTGVHVRDTGIVDNFTPLDDEARTLAEVFRDAGFATLSAVSAGHLGPEASGLGQGFDWVSAPVEDERPCTATIARLAPWLEETRGVPRFVWLHVFDAHAPYAPPAALERRYYPAGRDPRAPDLPEPPAHVVPRWAAGVRDLDYLVSLYASEVTHLDRELGELLEGPGLRDCVVLVTGDHGESLAGPHNWFTHKALLLETLQVPLVLAGPGVPRGQRRASAVSSLDVGRTLLDLAGLESADFPGLSLLRASSDPDPAALARCAISTGGTAASIRDGDGFLLLHLERHVQRLGSAPVPAHAVELYDLTTDPECVHDLASERPAEAARLRLALVQWLSAAQPTGWAVADREHEQVTLDGLAELGYAGPSEAPRSEVWFDLDCRCEECRRFE